MNAELSADSSTTSAARSFEPRSATAALPETFDDDAVAQPRGDRAEPTDQHRRTGRRTDRSRRSCCRGLARHAGRRARSPKPICSPRGRPAGRHRRARHGTADRRGRRRRSCRRPRHRHRDRVPWPRAAAVLLAARTGDAAAGRRSRSTTHTDGLTATTSPANPATPFAFDLSADGFTRLDPAVGDELVRRGAWARCVQIIGALDAAAELTVAHTRERVQFGRPLSKFQAVQHSLAAMAGEIERARAATTLAVAAAADYGFDSRADRLRGDGREGRRWAAPSSR